MCSQFLLIALRTEYSLLVYSARDCFQYVLYENTTFSDTIYIIIMTKYTPECTKLQHLNTISQGSMFALACIPHSTTGNTAG